MKFTFVVATYNIEQYIEECVDSILEQCNKIEQYESEIIIVNDGSTDSTKQIIETKYSNNPNIIIITQNNKGLSAVRNVGLSAAHGEYIIFIDGDDIVRKNTLLKLFGFCDKTESDIIAYGAKTFDESQETDFFVIDKDVEFFNEKPEQVLKGFLTKDYSFGWVVWHYVFKVSFLKENGLQFAEGHISEDVDFTLKAYTKAKTASSFLEDAVYSYRRSNLNSISRTAKYNLVYDLTLFMKSGLQIVESLNDEKLKTLIKLNYQTLIEVVLFWYSTYSKEQKRELSKMLYELKMVYNTPQEFSFLYKKKETFIKKMIHIFGFSFVGYLWGIKRRFKQ